jgi:hypothetical protein
MRTRLWGVRLIESNSVLVRAYYYPSLKVRTLQRSHPIAPVMCPAELKKAWDQRFEKGEGSGIEEEEQWSSIVNRSQQQLAHAGHSTKLTRDCYFYPFLWFTWFTTAEKPLYYTQCAVTLQQIVVSARLRQVLVDNGVRGISFHPVEQIVVKTDWDMDPFQLAGEFELVLKWREQAAGSTIPHDYYLLEIWSGAIEYRAMYYETDTCPICGTVNQQFYWLSFKYSGRDLTMRKELREQYITRRIIPPSSVMATDMIRSDRPSYKFYCNDLVREILSDEGCDVIFEPVEIGTLCQPFDW